MWALIAGEVVQSLSQEQGEPLKDFRQVCQDWVCLLKTPPSSLFSWMFWPLLTWRSTLYIIGCGLHSSPTPGLWASGGAVGTFCGPPSNSFPLCLLDGGYPGQSWKPWQSLHQFWQSRISPLLSVVFQPRTSLSSLCEWETNLLCLSHYKYWK